MSENYAILMDGGFVRAKLKQRNKHLATVEEISAEIERVKTHNALAGYRLMRVYYYDAPPATGAITNPIDGTKVDLGAHAVAAHHLALQQKLEMLPDVALRSGESAVYGWAIGESAMRSISKNGTRALAANDLVPNIEQKGVDLRIGLDIARLSIRQLAQVIVVVTGDSDMIPAFKFARREGVRVYLDHMGHGVKRDLKAHTDLIL